MSNLQSRYRFFRQHAGYIVGQRALCAIALARAELAAEEAGLTVVWAPDDDADWSWLAQADVPRSYRDAEHEVYYAALFASCECCGQRRDVLASMGGIFDPDADYRRVVNAELAQEALSVVAP